MPAKFVKLSPQGLEGKVLVYVREPNNDGSHSAIIAGSDFYSFVELYSQHLGINDENPTKCFLNLLGELDQEQGVAAMKTSLDDITNIADIYNCDIIEVKTNQPPFLPEDVRQVVGDDEMSKALNDYFENYKKEPEVQHIPGYKECTREEWQIIFHDLQDAMSDGFNKPEHYAVAEVDLKRLCKGAFQNSDQVIEQMCAYAQKENDAAKRKRVLDNYRDLVFALEQEKYEDAAKLRDKIKEFT